MAALKTSLLPPRMVADYRRLSRNVNQATIADDDPAELWHEAASWKRRYRLRNGANGAGCAPRSLEQPVSARDAAEGSRLELALSAPELPEMMIRDALTTRRMNHEIGPGVIREGELSGLLHAAYGRLEESCLPERRTVPSAGALFPLDIYVVSARIDDLSSGLYRYEPANHRLEPLNPSLSVAMVSEMLSSDVLSAPAACLIVVAGAFWRSRATFGVRGYRLVLLEAGHVMQNLALVGAAYGLAIAPIATFFDHELGAALGVDCVTEAPLYVAAIGGRE